MSNKVDPSDFQNTCSYNADEIARMHGVYILTNTVSCDVALISRWDGRRLRVGNIQWITKQIEQNGFTVFELKN